MNHVNNTIKNEKKQDWLKKIKNLVVGFSKINDLLIVNFH